MKRRIILMTAIAATFAIGCDDDEVGTFGPNETIVGFTADYAPKFTIDQPSATLNVPINLISYEDATFPGDVTVTVSVDEEATTAVVGTDYAGLTTTTVTIPSGSTVGFIPITVYPEVFNPDEPTKIVLNMNTVTTDNAIIGAQYSKVVVTLQGVCVSHLAGSYTNVTTRLSNGIEVHFGTDVITSTGDSDYLTQYIGQYHGTAFSPAPIYQGGALVGQTQGLASPSSGYDFTDICGKLQVPTQALGHIYTNDVRQSASQFANSFLNEETGQLTIHYSIFFTDNTVEVPFISVYTPL